MSHQNPIDQSIRVETVRFLVQKYVAEFEIDESQLKFDIYRRSDVARTVCRLVRMVSKIESEGVLEIDVPATWWQHLKRTLYVHSWVPDWVVARWPVKYDTLVYKAAAMFPKLPIPVDRPEFAIGFFNWEGG